MDRKLYLAPFQGITDSVYRNGFRIYFGGIDKCFCPYISSIKGTKVNRSKIRDLQPEKNNLEETVPQVLSKDAAEILLVSRQMYEWGYRELNWNLGCPFPRVAKKGRGSGMLQYPEKIKKILDEVMPQIPLKFSVKMRSGYQTHEEVYEVIEVLNKYPVSEIILHPRTGKQIYKGKANPAVFRAIKPLCTLPLAYNGDIYSPEDFLNIHNLCQADAYMLGRGALRYPFLASMLKGQVWDEKAMRSALNGFHEYVFEDAIRRLQGRVQILDRMKPIWAYLCHLFADPLRVFRKIRKTNTIEAYLATTKNILLYDEINAHPVSFAEGNSLFDGNYN